ncbi:hypothetical protein BH11PSE11_BH11PSE11_34500 [soil metagenome]
MKAFLAMFLVPAFTILGVLRLASHYAPYEFNPVYTLVVFSVPTAISILFIALPMRRWCRRTGRNGIGFWLLQWILVFIPASLINLKTAVVWYVADAAILLPVVGVFVATAMWLIMDCRPYRLPAGRK